MKKQIAKTVSILTLFVALSAGSVNVSAGGGACSIPSCRPRPEAVSTPPLKMTQTSAQDPNAQPENSSNLASMFMRWALSFAVLL